MSKKIKVSIGIPAFNEERNILPLMRVLSSQKQRWISIKEILVYSDGSTDKTVSYLKSVKDRRIKLKIGEARQGQQARQNQILKDFSGEILVLLEADTLPTSTNTIENLVVPFKNKKNLGMVVGIPVIISPRNFYEKILCQGYKIKYKVFADWKSGKNIYTCGGHSMKAISREFSKKLVWPSSVSEDAYIYLCLKKSGLKLEKSAKARAYMRNVTNLQDRLKQVNKFLTGKKALLKYFPEDLIKTEYDIPGYLTLKHLFIEFTKNPVLTTLYLLEVLVNRILTLGANTKKFNELYTPYQSSKELIQEGKGL